MNKPKISVVIPVYNVEKHLRKCLDSIVNQTYKNLEIILINDGSKDNSDEICREFAQKDDRIIYISRENRGVSATRNEGIEMAHGDYFSFIDSDDYLELDTYEYLLDIVAKHNVDAVNYEHFITYPHKETVHRIKKENYGLFDRKGAQKQLIYNSAFAWNKFFSKKIIENLRFDETILRGEDGLFARQAYDKADSVWFDSRPIYHYVQSEDSAVRGDFRPSQLTAIKLYDIYNNWYSKDYPEFLSIQNAKLNDLVIMLYCDMKADKKDYKSQQREVYDIYKKYYKQAMSCKDLSKKQKLKFLIFRISPNGFYLLHKFNLT